MTEKTKLQIMREKAGMTIEQLAMNALMIQIVNLNAYYNSLKHFENTVNNTIETLTICEKQGVKRGLENLEYIAQALDCSVDELIEE